MSGSQNKKYGQKKHKSSSPMSLSGRTQSLCRLQVVTLGLCPMIILQLLLDVNQWFEAAQVGFEVGSFPDKRSRRKTFSCRWGERPQRWLKRPVQCFPWSLTLWGAVWECQKGSVRETAKGGVLESVMTNAPLNLTLTRSFLDFTSHISLIKMTC